MNYRLVAKILGHLTLLIAAALLLSEIYAVLSEQDMRSGDHDYALLQAFVIAAVIGGCLVYFGRGSGNEILRKEAIAIVGLGWLVCAAVGAIPYMLATPGLDPAAAFFESASGFTTTGSSVIPDLDVYPGSILLWRALTQWLGGMGILVLFVALLSTLGVGSKSLFQHESSAQSGYGFHTRIRQMALRLWQIYTGLTAICILGLVILGMPVFDAVLNSFAAISSGGFCPRNTSIAAYDSVAIDAWLCLFMTLAGASFLLMAWVVRGGWKHVRRDEELRAYLLLLVAGSLLITCDLVFRMEIPFFHALRLASFQVISIMTTTGFVTADYSLWPTLSCGLLVLAMFVGGCAGSTSGGVKVGRVVVFFKTAGQQVRNAFRPNQHIPVRLNGETLKSEQIARILFFLSLTAFTIALSTIALIALEPQVDHISCFTAIISALFNIGPGLGQVGPTHTFAFFSDSSKILLSFLMILGRLEFFAILALFMPSLWKKY